MKNDDNRITDKPIGGGLSDEGTLDLTKGVDVFVQKLGFKDASECLGYLAKIVTDGVDWDSLSDNPLLEEFISELIERGYIKPHKKRKQKKDIHPQSEHGAIDS